MEERKHLTQNTAINAGGFFVTLSTAQTLRN